MCGIAGIVGEGASQNVEAVRLMINALKHRGPDGDGLFCSPNDYCVLGHRRLSIIDLTDAAAQPMLSPDGRFALVYNGECYNFQNLRANLIKRGIQFQSSGDAEVVLYSLVLDGVDALKRFNGMFTLAFWDFQERYMLLARDRFGQKPLYYTRKGKLLIFASEIQALIESGLVEKRVNLHSINSYLAYGAVQSPETIVQGIYLLPAGSFLEIHADGSEQQDTYWKFPNEKQTFSLSKLRQSFKDAVKRHLVSDVPIGLFLSGGIDSSAISAAAVRSKYGPVISLSVVFPEQLSQSEHKYARKMASFAGTDHREVPVTGRDMVYLLPKALNAMDQPTIDGINTFIVSYAAKQAGLKVALSGLGGDELFGGYPSFKDVPRMLFIRRSMNPIRRVIANLYGLGLKYSKQFGKISEMFESPNDLLGMYLTRRRLFSTRQIKSLIRRSSDDSWISGFSTKRFVELKNLIANRPILDGIGLLEMVLYMGETLLRDSDVMGMAHGLEIRQPFLDARFASYALALDSEARAVNSTPKHCFAEAMSGWIPRENVQRVKQGFSLPFQDWMLRDFRDEVNEVMSSLAKFGAPFCGEMIQPMWKAFCLKPERIGWTRPWSLFVLGRYLKTRNLTL